MDAKVQAVLDAYHERMDSETEQWRSGSLAGGIGRHADQMLLAVGPAAGQLMNILVHGLSAPRILELGTSYGYSAIWLAEAARATGGRVTTVEKQDYKAAYARDMAAKAGLGDHIDFKVGDAVRVIGECAFSFDFVLVDLWKDLYVACLEAFYPKLNPGAILVADNMIRPGGEDVARYAKAVRAKPHMSSVLLPVGQGLEISRYEVSPAVNP